MEWSGEGEDGIDERRKDKKECLKLSLLALVPRTVHVHRRATPTPTSLFAGVVATGQTQHLSDLLV